jgi:photosystem II stability/assembly factor-like uncharacterized protein
MKIVITKVIFITVLSLSFAVSSGAIAQGWFIRSSFSPAQTLQTIKFYDNITGYTVSSLYNGSLFNIYKTTDGGNTWTAQNSGYTSMRFMSIYVFHPDTVLISGNNGIIVKTTNGGSTWVTIPTGVTDQLWSLEFTSRTTGYCAGSSGRILKTTDGGSSWFGLNSGVQNQFYWLKFINDSLGYLCGSSILLRTTNRGNSWENMNFPSIPPFDQLRQLVFTDPATAYVIADIGRIRKTTDAGLNWIMLNTGTTEAIMGIDFVSPNIAYACGYNGVIIRTTDAGATWTPQASGLTEILTAVEFTSPDIGYISTWTGKILKTTNGGVTFVQPLNEDLPTQIRLYQNYPNPFNPTTIISYSLTSAGHVGLRVFDVLGREQAVLVDALQFPGTYSVRWELDGIASSLYVVQLQVGGTSLTRKMAVLK